MGLFDSLFSGPDEGLINQGYRASNKFARRGAEKQTEAVQAGVDKAAPNYTQAQDLWKGYTGQQQQGFDLYRDALGLNGPEGIARAQGSFQTSPGYQFQMDEGLNSVLRNNAASGNLNSGNALQALQERGQGLANQEWQTYLNRLQGFDPAKGISGQASALGDLASLYSNQGYANAGIQKGKFDQLGSNALGRSMAQYNAQAQEQANGLGMFGNLLGMGSQLLGLF